MHPLLLTFAIIYALLWITLGFRWATLIAAAFALYYIGGGNL